VDDLKCQPYIDYDGKKLQGIDVEAVSIFRSWFIARGTDSLHVETEEDKVFACNAPHEGPKGEGASSYTSIARIGFEPMGGCVRY
jgi:hypothetical protein